MSAVPSTRRDKDDVAPQRVVVLGASNVTLSITAIFQSLTSSYDAPIEFLAAHGHGRSYGIETSVLGRRLPSIRDCGLWNALERREPRPTKVLLTDIGNDLIYGQTVDTLFGWVCDCVDRLASADNEIAVAQLPIVNFDRITPRKFAAMKRIFFPSCEVDLSALLERARKISQLLEKEFSERSIRIVEPIASWYGWDPIHVRRRCWSEAWPAILAFSDAKTDRDTSRHLSLWQKLQIKCVAPHERVIFGRKQRKSQPVACFSDGSTISFY